MMQMAQPKVLLHDISLLRDLAVPLNLSVRYLRPRRVLPHDPIFNLIEMKKRSIRLPMIPLVRIHFLDRLFRMTARQGQVG